VREPDYKRLFTLQTDKDLIVFCGVRFMAKTAKLRSPEKTALLPTQLSGCSLAESITVDDVRWVRDRFPGVPVVTAAYDVPI